MRPSWGRTAFLAQVAVATAGVLAFGVCTFTEAAALPLKSRLTLHQRTPRAAQRLARLVLRTAGGQVLRRGLVIGKPPALAESPGSPATAADSRVEAPIPSRSADPAPARVSPAARALSIPFCPRPPPRTLF